MLNYRKIAKVLLVAAFFCTFIGAVNNNSAWAVDYSKGNWGNNGSSYIESGTATTKAKTTTTAATTPKIISMNGNSYYKSSAGKWMKKTRPGIGDVEVRSSVDINDLNKKLAASRTQAEIAADKSKTEAGAQKFEENWRKTTGKQNVVPEFHSCPEGTIYVDRDKKCVDKKELVNNRCSMPEYKDTEACKIATGKKEEPKAAGSNKPQTDSGIKGCKQNRGLFSGLITTGEKIFSGLRDLIYVVAGFGIIGVAVGGFFGNLNWKWLGAIIIGLVVIATTGELINAITGCPDYTSSMIADTLK